MRKWIFGTSSVLGLLLVTVFACAQEQPNRDPTMTEIWEPVPPKVEPATQAGAPPSDAIVLFDGSNLNEWTHLNGDAAKWDVAEGVMTVKPGTGNIKTKKTFGDVQMHIEWRSPAEPNRTGQDKGNSGIFLQERYELQVLNNYTNQTYVNGQASSVYKQHPPLVNATRKEGEWQVYDIVYTAPRFAGNGKVVIPARITVLHNGVLTQNNVSIWGPTEYIGLPVYKAHGKGGIILQDHSNPVSYRNVWIRELDK